MKCVTRWSMVNYRFVWMAAMVFAALFVVTTLAYGSTSVVVKPRWKINEPLISSAAGCDHPEDAMRVVVMENGKELAYTDICSSYGVASAAIFSDENHNHYIFVKYNVGRGSNVTKTYLMVYGLSSNLIELMKLPISWATGPTQRFNFKYKIEDDSSGGIQIVLDGQADSGSKCCVPQNKYLVIKIDSP